MAAELKPTKPSRWTGVVKKTKKIFKWTVYLLAILLVSFIYFKYFFTYSEGYRAGLLQKFSSKGMIL
jgi:uncharacterized membrane protein YukC